jgi:hypothetical protein
LVKAKDDYDKRMDDSRFKNFDKVLDPSYGQKQYYILVAGLIFVCVMLATPMVLTYMNSSQQATASSIYENGLNISYEPSNKVMYVTFSNPNNDTLNLITTIQVPYDAASQANLRYIQVYDYSTSKFPTNITYSPSPKISNLQHIILVTLVKETGNYTYTYSAIPDTENKLWEGTGQYVDKITKVFNQS